MGVLENVMPMDELKWEIAADEVWAMMPESRWILLHYKQPY